MDVAAQQGLQGLHASLAHFPQNQRKYHLPSASRYSLHSAALFIHDYLSQHNIPYYFCGGFACISIGGTPRLTADIDVVVESGRGYHGLLNLFSDPHFIYDQTRILSESPFFYVEQTGELVEVDGLPAGWGGIFPRLGEAATVVHNGFRFLDLATLLRMKLRAWGNPTRRASNKGVSDQADIISLRSRMQAHSLTFSTPLDGEERAGLNAWIEQYDDEVVWDALGAQSGGCIVV